MITRTTIERMVAMGKDGEAAAAELYRAAFRLVIDANGAPRDWKARIDATLVRDECPYAPEVVCDAIAFMTATEAVLDDWPIPSEFRVKAAGYRAGPAGP